MFHVLKILWKFKVQNNISGEVSPQICLRYIKLHVSVLHLGGWMMSPTLPGDRIIHSYIPAWHISTLRIHVNIWCSYIQCTMETEYVVLPKISENLNIPRKPLVLRTCAA